MVRVSHSFYKWSRRSFNRYFTLHAPKRKGMMEIDLYSLRLNT